jgi:hypothetical protein
MVVQIGSFITAVPFLESLKAARIVAARYGRTIRDFTAALVVDENDPLATGIRENGFLPGDASVLGAADEDRRAVLIGDYGEIIRGIHAGALKAAGWDA